MPARPNLLFVFADQLRSRDLDAPDHPLVTPAYDRLCEEGTRCLDTVANCPVCTPSRAMLLTGQYPWVNRVPVNDIPLPEDAVTIGEICRAAGYRTGYIGKWHLDGVPRNRFTPPGPRRHGFDHWAVFNCTHDYYRSGYFGDDETFRPYPGYEPEHQTSLAGDFLRAADDRPFCLCLSWGPPHEPYHLVPEWFRRLYDPARLRLPANFRPADLSLLQPGYPARACGLDLEPTVTLAQYYAAISALDYQLLRLLEILDETGRAADTIVVYTSDHGDMLFSHGRGKKQQPWDESVHIPFVIRWPGQLEAGVDRRGCLGIIDFAPTLLGLLGLEPPTSMQGANLADWLAGGPQRPPTSSYLMDLLAVDQGLALGVPEWRGVRTRRHTYARTLAGPWLLYDNLADPDQLVNLLEVPGHEGLRQTLEEELRGWLERTGDPFEPGEAILRRLGLIELWNARERELRGPRARLIEATS